MASFADTAFDVDAFDEEAFDFEGETPAAGGPLCGSVSVSPLLTGTLAVTLPLSGTVRMEVCCER